MENEWLAEAPFDLYELHLFLRVVESGSFTRASQQAGLTQSAVTRQIQGMEERLGMRLFERTTRRVRMTPAGEMLAEDARRILKDTGAAVERLKERFELAPKRLRVGVSRSIGLAYLPGFFFAYRKRCADVRIAVATGWGDGILERIKEGDLDVGLLCPPKRMPSGLKVTHRFDDGFVIIAPPDAGDDVLATNPPWLALESRGNTAGQMDLWLRERGLGAEPAMELNSFDLIINLVSQGMGVSLVPHRALALYNRQRAVKRLPHPKGRKFVRELVVVVRRDRSPPEHLEAFVESVLF